jgi:hypothetical protein
MTEKIKKINNPLTIIAFFAALAEVNATVALGLIDKNLHYIFIWFIIGFPTILVICFFLTLNFNTKVMYSPSDYKEDKSFMDLFRGNYGSKIETKSDFSNVFEELEQKITNKLTQKFEQIKESDPANNNIQEEINKINIKQITGESIQELRLEPILKGELKEIMLSFYQFPAYYLLIYGIIRSKSTTIEELRRFTDQFYIPKSWEVGALDRLFSEQLIIGDQKSFVINDKFAKDLNSWTIRNSQTIRIMSQEYEKLDNIDNEDDNIKFREYMTRRCARLKF